MKSYVYNFGHILFVYLIIEQLEMKTKDEPKMIEFILRDDDGKPEKYDDLGTAKANLTNLRQPLYASTSMCPISQQKLQISYKKPKSRSKPKPSGYLYVSLSGQQIIE